VRTLNDWILRFSRSWPLFALAALVTFGSVYLFTGVIAPRFVALTQGSPPFDLQNALTVEQVFEQLADYPEDAKRLYYLFSAIDFAFPVFASLFLAGITAFSLRYLWPGGYEWVTARRLWVLMLLPAMFDWLENVFALTVITAYGQELRVAAAMMIYAKMGKLSLTAVAQLLAWGLLFAAGIKWAATRLGRGASH
jgi:hypothetical protein